MRNGGNRGEPIKGGRPVSDPNIPASEQAERENLSHRRPEVMRMAEAIATGFFLGEGAVLSETTADQIAAASLMIVEAVDRLCGNTQEGE